ncbi:LuxR C-terminal-related transcriptional regulator [Streptomyces sp. NBC_00122]|uniref:helix-turn-helix transcriptional regulator n=1 Tax=Streptomyces sp. NBC_00122 TaxID=2903623 RepID=UPI003870982F
MPWGIATSADWPTAGRESEIDHVERALAGPRGVLLSGEWGVGKSRLLHAALERAAAGGAATLWAGGAVPTGASGSLADALRQFPRVPQSPPATPSAAGPVLGLDDAHLIDPAVAACLYALVRDGRIRLIATALSGVAMPGDISALWVERLVERVEVPHFDRTTAGEVLQARLGGQLSADCAERLWTATRGNALLLRELTDAALSDGALRREDALWQWRGELPAAPGGRPAALVQLRLNDLRPDERELVQLVALAEPLEADLPAAAGLAHAAESLNRSGLLVTERSGPRLRLRLAYPLYSAVVLRAMPELEGRRLRRQLADGIEAVGMRRHDDVRRVVDLRLAAGQTPPTGQLRAAAERALRRHDFGKAETLPRTALSHPDGPADEAVAAGVRLVLVQALQGRGRHREAERVLAEAPGLPAGLTDEATAVRAVNMAFGLGRLGEAVGVVERGLTTAQGTGRLRFRGARALLGLLEDRFADVSAAAAGREGAPPPREGALAGLVTVPAAFALVERGDPVSAARLLAGLPPDPEEGTTVDTAAQWMRTYAALHTAGVAAAAALLGGMQWWDEGDPRDRVRVALLRVRLHRARGDRDAAVDELRRAAAVDAPADWLTAPAWTLAQLAAVLAEAGAHAEAVRTLVEVRSLEGRGVRYPLAQDGTALESALVYAHVGDRAQAVRLALSVARSAGAAGRRAQEVSALHLAARLGATEEAVGSLPELTVLTGTTALQARHVQALALHDGDALEELTRRFAALGLRPLAAETAAQAAQAHQADGRHRRGRAARLLCQEITASTGGGLPPWAGAPERRREDLPAALTLREREVAALVAAGLTNQEVADRLYVSVRTVENHLHRTYGKLGITARSELARRLDPGAQRSGCVPRSAP